MSRAGGSRGGDARCWAALNQIEGLGAAAMLRLARVFGSPEDALRASREELVLRGRLSPGQAREVARAPDSLDLLAERIAAWAEAGIALIAIGDPDYPEGLSALRTPPPLLYVRGELAARDAHAVAVVGSREPTAEGEAVAERLAGGLAERGFTIVSGLARGIDTAGHRGALAAAGGRTVAVLGCGLRRVYPPENVALAEEIARRGCLVAEVPPEREVSRGLLLARDRIQAALSRAVIVVQAHRVCGSIVTASHAVACGRLLYGVPWAQPPFSEGWEKLGKMGARPLEPGADLDLVAQEIARAVPPPPEQPAL